MLESLRAIRIMASCDFIPRVHNAPNFAESSASCRMAIHEASTIFGPRNLFPRKVFSPTYSLSPLDDIIGTSPRNDANWRWLLKRPMSSISASRLMAIVEPMPGTDIRMPYFSAYLSLRASERNLRLTSRRRSL